MGGRDGQGAPPKPKMVGAANPDILAAGRVFGKGFGLFYQSKSGDSSKDNQSSEEKENQGERNEAMRMKQGQGG